MSLPRIVTLFKICVGKAVSNLSVQCQYSRQKYQSELKTTDKRNIHYTHLYSRLNVFEEAHAGDNSFEIANDIVRN